MRQKKNRPRRSAKKDNVLFVLTSHPVSRFRSVEKKSVFNTICRWCVQKKEQVQQQRVSQLRRELIDFEINECVHIRERDLRGARSFILWQRNAEVNTADPTCPKMCRQHLIIALARLLILSSWAHVHAETQNIYSNFSRLYLRPAQQLP